MKKIVDKFYFNKKNELLFYLNFKVLSIIYFFQTVHLNVIQYYIYANLFIFSLELISMSLKENKTEQKKNGKTNQYFSLSFIGNKMVMDFWLDEENLLNLFF